MVKIITEREKEIIKKKINNLSLTQNESNILSKSVRPKLKEMRKINVNMLLNKLEYNQKARSIEKKIKEIILKNVSHVAAIIICGSAIQTNYNEYNDIDVIIATKKLIKNQKKKRETIEKLENSGKKEGLNLDIQIYAKNSILEQYPYNPSLIYQLKDSKTIYRKFRIPSKVNLSSLDLRMKLDWSEGLDINSEADEMYYAIRNAMLVLLLMNKKIDNYELKRNLTNVLGADLIDKLRNNKASKLEKKLAFNYLNLMVNYLEKELKNKKWEKIGIENL